MVHLKQISTLFHLLIITISAQAEDPDAKKQAEIKALEKQKSELFKQINEAIDDSVKTLAEANDTDSKLGIDLIKDLKKQLEELNGTEAINDQIENQNDTRRRGKKDARKWQPPLINQRSKDDELFEDELMKKAVFSQKHKDRLEHRIQMQGRVEEWLQKKAEEKRKLKLYYMNRTSTYALLAKEKCPVYGVEKKKKKKNKRIKFNGVYGCCRKCCKKSYMGCLKKK